MSVIKNTAKEYRLLLSLVGILLISGIVYSTWRSSLSAYSMGSLVGMYAALFAGLCVDVWYEDDTVGSSLSFVQKKVVQYLAMILSFAVSAMVTVAVVNLL